MRLGFSSSNAQKVHDLKLQDRPSNPVSTKDVGQFRIGSVTHLCHRFPGNEKTNGSKI